MYNIDDYAWYEVGGQRYYNKEQAIYAHLTHRLPIHWNVTDSDYDLYKWDVEPAQSLEELYAQRAQDIRNRYDYLVLHFSGGDDSANILETFIKNNIHLDEILVRGSFSAINAKAGVTSANDQYGECLVQGVPLAQWVKDNHMPHVKITLVDTVEIINNFYAKNPNWVDNHPWAHTPSAILKVNLDLLSPHFGELHERGRKVAHIIGVEKPTIYRNKNYFYTKFADKAFQEYLCFPDNINFRPQYVELFYWGKHAISLQIKQLHVLKNYIKQHNLHDHDFDPSRRWTVDPRLGRQYERLLAGILYNRTLPLLSEHEKEASPNILKSRDSWFAKDQNSDAFINYQRGINYMSVVNDSSWHATEGNFWNHGLKGINSKLRFLGT